MAEISEQGIQRFRAAVFDLDGTLVDSEPAWTKAKRTVAQRHNVEITDAQMVASEGRSMDELVQVVFAPPDKHAARAIEEEVFAEAAIWLPKLRREMPGAGTFLRDVRDAGLKIAICSSSPENLILDALRQIEVLDQVDLVVSADPMPRRKPDPMPYRVTAERLGMTPTEIIAFEDAVPGARSAKDAGLFTVGIGPAAMTTDFEFCDLRARDYPSLRGPLGM
ncbi:HAD family hydrolase [Paracoccus albus]|uniref:HAD family hydrolase n=1 Tax=Paracoccus albus TaxID=3017784 RepID=UPI0022F0A813|nr:HAD family phosphatase [Paracoccus albus]WBU59962.1 HAD family phosphatase [Paracoccus albus]